MSSHNHETHHITPIGVYFKIGALLFGLTFLTIGFHLIHNYLGPFANLIAFAIAGVKAYLVLAWFMHLKYDTLLNRMIFASGFFFLLLLFVISAIDVFSRAEIASPL